MVLILMVLLLALYKAGGYFCGLLLGGSWCSILSDL